MRAKPIAERFAAAKVQLSLRYEYELYLSCTSSDI